MAPMSRWRIACVVSALALSLAPPTATPWTMPPDPVSAAQEYRASLAKLLPFREDAVARARETLTTRRRLAEEGLIARRDAEAAEAALAAAEAALATTQAEIAQTERTEAEAVAAAVLASLPKPAPGAATVTPTLTRFRGPREWSLGAALTSLEQFFEDRFRRALPVSALGQTPVHDRLGFDHRNALDVAVHPDSVEGQALVAWLRARGVSFLAFRGPVAGEATGAHVHIGEPSPRLSARPGPG
jgi:hypothetical protein